MSFSEPVVFDGPEADELLRSLESHPPGHAERVRRSDATYAELFSAEPANDLF